MSSSACSRAA
ncbi:hypothetical protein ECFRIK1997_5974, partial [Escherichia coli FRIK1997]